MKLSVAIIAKNEEEMIQNCLESVKNADEIVFVDTGSSDRTIDIASKYTDRIYIKKWEDDFSKAYNHVASLCDGEWILSIDADEQLEDGGLDKIKNLIDPTKFAYMLRLDYFTYIAFGIKLFKNRAGIHWIGKAHKILNIPVESILDVCISCECSPTHREDPNRTLRILKRDFYDTPSNIRNVYYLAREYANRHNFQEAIDLFSRYFEEGNDRFLQADACLYLAKLYRATEDMRLSRAWADKATHVLPEFKEAWDFCAFIAQDKFKKLAYLKFYDIANNKNVRTIRKFRWTDSNIR